VPIDFGPCRTNPGDGVMEGFEGKMRLVAVVQYPAVLTGLDGAQHSWDSIGRRTLEVHRWR